MEQEDDVRKYDLETEIGETLEEYHDSMGDVELRTKNARNIQLLYTLSIDEQKVENEYILGMKELDAKKEELELKRRELDLKEKEIEATVKVAKIDAVISGIKTAAGVITVAGGIAATLGITYCNWVAEKEGLIPKSKNHIKPLTPLEFAMRVFKV